MIKYNSTYDRWVTDDGKVYRQDKSGAFIVCKQSKSNGYLIVRLSKPFRSIKRVHRLVYETFKGLIPDGMEIDHADTNTDNNALDNLILCSHKENCNNPKTKKHYLESNKDKIKGKTTSEFGDKFKEHYGMTYYECTKLYKREYEWYIRHNKVCRWE